MTRITTSLFWQLVGWIIDNVSKAKHKKPNKELMDFLKSKGFHFEVEKNAN